MFLRYRRSIWECGNGSDGKDFYLLIGKSRVEHSPLLKLSILSKSQQTNAELPVELENTEVFKGTLCFSMAYSKSSTDVSLDVRKSSLLSDLCTSISKSVRATSEKKAHRHSFGDGVEPGMHCLVLTLSNGGGVYSKRFLYGIAAPIG